MSQQNRTKIIGLISIVLISTAATTGVVLIRNMQSGPGSYGPNIVSSVNTTTTSGSTPVSNANYKDGTYTATGSFYTPSGNEQIGVTVTLASNKITNVSIDDSSIYSGTSFAYTDQFAHGINAAVDGKNVDSVNVSRVSGASLTPMAFNSALDTIKNDARA